MRNTPTTTKENERSGLRGIAAIALIGSLAAFGCTTNKYPGNGEPSMSAPAAGPVAPNATSTPGSSSGTSGSPPSMISSAPAEGISASVDAIATLKADEGYRGKVLGPAAPGNNAVGQSTQQPTGEFVSPSLYANPQITVNSSISSQPTPVIASGAGEPLGGVVAAVPVTTVAGTVAANALVTPSASVPTPTAITNSMTNVGSTGVSNVTATPLTNTNTMTTASGAISTSPTINKGVVSAAAPASSASPTPILGTTGPMNHVNNGTIASTPAKTNTTTTTSTKTPTMNATTAGIRTNMPSTGTVHVESTNGAVVVTNEKSATALQRFLSAIGLRRRPATGSSGQ